MKSPKKLLERARANPRIPAALLVLALLGSAVVMLNGRATQEADARKSLETLHLETSPEDWLAHPQNVSEFRKALDAGTLAVVGLASGQAGLVLYTLKTGEKASSTVPGCSASGCTGTVLDRLGDMSAKAGEAGFALVSIDVDPRTTACCRRCCWSRRWSARCSWAPSCRPAWAVRRQSCRRAPRRNSRMRSATMKPRRR